jgi:nicotinamidase-related amidase
MSRSVLLVIDVLNDFFCKPPLSGRRAELASGINQLISSFRESGQPIIWVRQEFRPDLQDAFLEMRKENISITIAGTEGAQILPELDVQPEDTIIVKKRYSAFFGTPLEEILATLQPGIVVVGGVNTHACVRTTVVDAYQRDYEVVVAAECTASNDEKHHDITMRYFENGIARFLSNSEIRETFLLNAPDI